MEKNKSVNIFEVNVLYLVMGVLLLTVGSIVQMKDIRIGLIITEYFLVLLPPIIFMMVKQINIAKFIRLNRLRIKHGLLIIAITILSYPIALFFNLLVLTILSKVGNISQPSIPTASNFTEYIILMLIISLSAGICEEVFFRGFIMRGYEGLGKIQAIVVSAFLFGLFHFNIQNIVGPIVLGIVFGYLVYRTNSLYAGIIGHATNNGIAVTIGYLVNLADERLLQQELSAVQQMPGTLQMVMSTVAIGMVALVTGLSAFWLLRIIIKDTEIDSQQDRGVEEEGLTIIKTSLWTYAPVYLTVLIFVFIGYLQIRVMIG